MKTVNYTGPSRGWTARWPRLLPVVIGSIVLCVSSCRSPARLESSRRTERTQTDSLLSATLLAVTREAIPPSRATLRLTPAQLTSLPPEAAYTQHSGQATARVQRSGHGDTLIVTATCDSLQRELLLLMGAYEQLRRESATDSASMQREEPGGRQIRASPTGWQWFQIWTGRIALLWIAIQTGLKLYSNSKRKTI